MRVLLVNDCPPGQEGVGGAETHVRQLQAALITQGIETAVLANQSRGQPELHEAGQFLIPELNAPLLRKHFLCNRRQQQTALKNAEEVIRRFRPDVINVHNFMNPHVLRLLRKSGPVVKSLHDCRPFCVKPPPVSHSRLIGDTEEFCDITFGRRCWRRCYARSGNTCIKRIEAWSFFPANLKALDEILKADHIVTYGRYLKELALRRFNDEQRIHIVHHFSDAEQASAGFTPPPVKEPIFLFAGRLSSEKAPHHIFQALKRIPEISCRVIIAGDGPLRKSIEQSIPSCSPCHRIEMKGFIDQARLYELYREASVLLFPSIGSEGCPLVGIEAMYFGNPVIGYDTGGAGEWLVDGLTGIRVQRGDTGGLARAMAELASDPERTARLGTQAHAYVSRKFKKEKHIGQLIEIYKQAIQDQRNRAL